MSKARRVREVLIGLLTIACAVVMMCFPEVGYYLVIAFLSISLTLSGLSKLVYYLKVARHMVGGKSVLYSGIILYDLGILSASVSKIPAAYVMLYLFGVHFFSGVVSVLRAREARQFDASSWKYSLAEGIANIVVAILCVCFIGSPETAVYIYCGGLIYSALIRIAMAMRRTAIVYIQ